MRRPTVEAPTLSEWLAQSQAGKRLGVTPQRIVQLARAGRLARLETPLGRLLDPADLERFIRERRRRDPDGPAAAVVP